MRHRVGLAVALALVAAGCATERPSTTPPERSRLVEADRTAVLDAAGAFLERQGLGPVAVDRGAGTLRAGPASATSTAWSSCPRVRVRDADGERRRDAEQLAQTVEVLVDTARQGGRTRVRAQVRYTQTLRNSFTNLTFERRCASTGGLERAVLDAL